MSESRADRAARIRHLLATEGDAIYGNTSGFNQGRYDAVAELADYEALKDEARATKEDAIDRLPELIEELRESVEANGGSVYIADDPADANEYIAGVCEAEDAETLVKSKSMTSEEIEVNEHLQERGVDVWETDLGEFVIQLAEESPSHIVGPAIHKSRDAIADLFNEQFDPDPPLSTAQELTEFARDELGTRMREADVGMTGANFITADTGTMALVTSEGNARKSVASADTHIAVAGVEKIVPTVEDLQPFVELIARSSTGQDITSYVSLLTPPIGSPTMDVTADAGDGVSGPGDGASGQTAGPKPGDPADREFHLVLIDNGRMEIREDPQLRETLYCIRCGACLNSCANFQQVGGHAFGGETYSGGIGTGWEYTVGNEEQAGEASDFCTSCTRCVNQCPVKIDIPWINTVVADRMAGGADPSQFDSLVDGLVPDEQSGRGLRERAFANFDSLARLASATAPVSNWLADTEIATQALARVGIDPRRDAPTFQRETLVEWAANRQGAASDGQDANAGPGAGREVVLYPDVYTNHVLVDRGKAAVRTLEALGVDVRVPSLPESGRAPLSQEMIETARSRAEDVAAGLDSHLAAGRDVVVVEPSDLAMFRRDYEKLLPDEDYERLRAGSYDLLAYVERLLASADREKGLGALSSADGETVAYHSHCQQRTMGLEGPTVSVLEELGYDVTTSSTECCGMAGSFGYKSEFYDLSMAVGEHLREDFAGEYDHVAASGTSCQEQLGDLLDSETVHPVELIAPPE